MGGGHKIGHFCGRHKCMTPKWFKITNNSIIRGSSPLNGLKWQTIQSLEAAVSTSTSSHKPDTFWLRREQPPTPTAPRRSLSPLSPLHWWPNQSMCYIQLALNFLCEKIICPIKNPFEQGSVKDVASPLIFFFCLEL